MKLTVSHGWTFGSDPRRPGGLTLVSPRGTLYEFRAGRIPSARKYTDPRQPV